MNTANIASNNHKTQPTKPTKATLGKSARLAKVPNVIDEWIFLLADLQVINQYLRNFHWNIEGDQFIELHEFFQEQYELTSEQIDELAERMKTIGKIPLGTMKEVLHYSRIKEPVLPLSPKKMLSTLKTDLKTITISLQKSANRAMKTNDFGTFYILSSVLKDLELTIWKIDAMLI